MDAVNEQVTGTIGLKLYKGSARVVTRESPNAVYDAALATFDDVRRAVLPAGLAGLHRAVVAAVAHGLPLARAPGRVVSGAMRRTGYEILGFTVWHGAKWYLRRRIDAMLPSRRVVAVGVVGAVLAVRGRGGRPPRAYGEIAEAAER